MSYYAYVGAGAFVHGVPARDLTEAEWDALDEQTQAAALARPLYTPTEPPPDAPAAEPGEE